MSDPATITQSNVFGSTTTTSTAGTVEPTSSESSAAGKLVDHLKYVADTQLTQAANRAAWLALAANQGQNTSEVSLVKGELLKPTPLTRALSLQAGWNIPAMVAAPLSLPALPDNLKLDLAGIHTLAADDLADLQESWMAQYLPAATDLGIFDTLLDSTLGGSAQLNIDAQLNGLTADMTADLKAIIDALLARLNSLTSTATSNLATNFTSAAAGIDAATAVASDATDTIAWTRARDNATREADRLEEEAISDWAGRGFSLPGGALVTQAQKGRQATQSVASDIAAQRAEKTQTFFYEIAKETISAYLRKMEAQSNLQIQSFQAITDAYIKAAGLQLDADKFKARQAFDNLGLTLDFTKFTGELAVKYRLGVIGSMNDLIRAYTGNRSNETEYLNAITRAQREAQAAVVEYYRAAMASAELGFKVDLTNTDTNLKWADMAGRFIGTAVGHHVQAAAAAADVFGRNAGMALSSLNGIASIAASG